ncbi:hypothetical protein ET445_10025 [Agromyces protaetiae]|uniref:Type I restriction modification DNA specificity domain-containing protein n=1 Tax=Agromyces protaetiae TaxID=2509455 RepID=A0A4P6FGN7_9MICO|nr:restriction endonuclease subunit S [Agromyces protaetiae]QAY73629.1 hypothetical protein ET445_10025 [Agromyces protaetiae]
MTLPGTPNRGWYLDWVGPLPAGWETRAVGRVSWVRARLGWKGLTADEYVDSGGVAMIATPNIKHSAIDYANANQITYERYEESPEIMLARGDVLLTKDGSTIGTVNIVRDLPAPATVNGSIAVITPASTLDGRFLYWTLASQYARSLFDRLKDGMGVPHLFQRDINRIAIPYPTINDQRLIADYLDHEIGSIDTLIAKQQRLIASLGERRRSTIQSLALAGFAPLGQAQRESIPIGALFTVVLGKMLDAGKARSTSDSDLPYIRAANIQDGGLALSDVNRMPYSLDEAQRLNLQNGDLLVVEGGAVGTSVLLREDMPGWSFQKTVNRVRSVDNASTAWLGYVLRSYRDSGVIDILCDGSTIAHLTAEKLRALRIPLLPVERQAEIALELDARTAKIDTLISKTEQFIALAKERRAALITAAVTGQIDVTTKAA